MLTGGVGEGVSESIHVAWVCGAFSRPSMSGRLLKLAPPHCARSGGRPGASARDLVGAQGSVCNYSALRGVPT